MTVKLLTEHHLASLGLNGATQACMSLHLSKCHIVENLMSQLNYASVLLIAPRLIHSGIFVSILLYLFFLSL